MNLVIQLERADEFAYATAALQTVVFMRMTHKYWIGRAKRLACIYLSVGVRGLTP